MPDTTPKYLGVFPKNDSSNDSPIWVFSSGREFYTTFELSPHVYSNQMKRNQSCPVNDNDECLYVVRYINRSVYDSFKGDPAKRDYVIECIKTNRLTSLHDVTTTIKMRRCEGLGSCGTVKPLSTENFEMYPNGTFRQICRECRNEKYKAVKEDTQDDCTPQNGFISQDGHLICKACNKEKSKDDMLADRRLCKVCYRERRKKADEKRLRESTVDWDNMPGRPCSNCGKSFDRTDWTRKTFTWGSWCRACVRSAKHWVHYRERKRNEDLETYLNNRAEHQRTWREAHPEEVAKYNEARRTDSMMKIRTYVTRARSLGVRIEEDTTKVEELAALLTKACHYCGSPPPQNGLNGLDRLGKDYLLSGVVTACQACNMVKGQYDAQEFLARMQLWDEGRRNRNEDVDLTSQMVSRMGNPKNPQVPGRKNGYSVQKKHQGTCYMCGYEGLVNSDRLDSTLPYTADGNIKDCCGICNIMKKDYSYVAVMAHAARICEFQAYQKIVDEKLNVDDDHYMDDDVGDVENGANDENDEGDAMEVGHDGNDEDVRNEDEDVSKEMVTPTVQTDNSPPRKRHRWKSQHYGYVVYDGNEVVAAYVGLNELSQKAKFNKRQLEQINMQSTDMIFGKFRLEKIGSREYNEKFSTFRASENVERQFLTIIHEQLGNNSGYSQLTRDIQEKLPHIKSLNTLLARKFADFHASKGGRSLPISLLKEDRLITIYASASDAAKDLQLSIATMNRRVKQGSLQLNGEEYRVRKATLEEINMLPDI